jgi:choline-sulfatase
VAPGDVRARLRALGRPNVVLIVVDTLRPDWTTPYGDPRNPTPELERWARRGAVFERVLAQSSWTKVSMASLLTSLWPHTHGVRATTDALGDAALSVAEVFRDAGYRTAAVQSNGWLEQSFGFQQGFDRYTFAGGGGLADRPSVWPHADNVYLEAEHIIDAHPPEAPLFLYIHFMDVHEYAAPPDLQRFGRDDRGAYLAAIAWVDEVLGRLRRRLDRAGLLGRTLLVLASDHGEAFGENGVHGHARNVLDAELRVPLVVRFPFPVRPLRVAAQVRNLDIAPTLLDLAGIPIPGSFEGRSLLPLLTGEEPAVDRTSFAALTALLFTDATLQESVCDGRWTFARAPGGGRERLFDQSVDPADNVDLAQIETARAAALRARLDAHLAQPPAAGAAQRDVRIDPELAQKLRALGYLR